MRGGALSSYSDCARAVGAQADPRLVVKMIIDGEWSTVAWLKATKTHQVKIEGWRKTR